MSREKTRFVCRGREMDVGEGTWGGTYQQRSDRGVIEFLSQLSRAADGPLTLV